MNALSSRLAILLALLLGACTTAPPPAMHGGDPLDPAAAAGRDPAPASQPAQEPEQPPAGGHGYHDHGARQAPDGPAEEAAAYTCPMHPQVRQPAPGKCPICGMALVKTEKQR